MSLSEAAGRYDRRRAPRAPQAVPKCPQLKQAYTLRQQLTAIFDQHLPKTVGQQKIRSWIERVRQSGLKCFDTFLKTLERWWEEITNYFDDRANSGFVEGLNNKLKVRKRRCYGIFNLGHLFQ